MIETSLNFFVILLSAIILIQDLKYRAIHYLGLVGLFVLSTISLNFSGLELSQVYFSYIYLLVCFVAGYIYFVIKNKKFFNPFLSLMGVGDVFYYISVVLFFNTSGFILYFVCSLIFSMFSFLILSFFNKKANTIPLAGFSSLFFLMLKLVALMLNKDFFYQKIAL